MYEIHIGDRTIPRSGDLKSPFKPVGDCKSPLLGAARVSETNPMYIWRKFATDAWLGQHNESLERRFGGAFATIERPGKVRIIVEISCPRRSEAVHLQDEFGGKIERLASDWLQQFAKRNRTRPLRIGSRLQIGRTAGPNTIVIPAEAAFGTGDHATTAMSLRMLERITRGRDDWALLDAGTGSGILAIAGSCFGAKRIVAIDNDPIACAVAKRNARRNRKRNIEFRTGDVLKQKIGAKFDVITANLFSEILIAALPIFSRHLEDHGRLIFSGVLRSQERALITALDGNDFRVEEIKRRGRWIAILASRPRKRS
jgi:ribosomal protein L11 methyltransferase